MEVELRLIPLGLVARSFDGVSGAAARQLVDTVYDQASSLAVGSMAMVLVGIMAYLRSHAVWFLVWSGLALVVAVGRFVLCSAYRRYRNNVAVAEAAACDSAHVIWARRFVAGTWISGALWGVANLAIVLCPDAFIHFLVITAETAWALGGAVRLNAVRVAVVGQLFLVMAPLFLACLAAGDPFYQAFSVFVVLNLLACLSITRSLRLQTMGLLLANEDKTALNQQLENLAVTDMLTAIANRRGFDVRLAQEWRRLRREQRPLSLLLLDIDHFKQFNDLYGHQAGDECLRLVAEAIELSIRRPGDIAARYGGEEFAVILLDTTAEGAVLVAEAVRASVEALAIPHGGSPLMRVTASVGVSTVIPTPETGPALLVGLADDALYRAKRLGRNRVFSAPASAVQVELADTGLADPRRATETAAV